MSWWLDKNARQRTEAFLEPESAAVPFNDHGTMLEKSYAGPNTAAQVSNFFVYNNSNLSAVAHPHGNAAQERWHAKHEETEKQEQQHQLNNVELSLQYGTIALLLGYLKSTSSKLCASRSPLARAIHRLLKLKAFILSVVLLRVALRAKQLE